MDMNVTVGSFVGRKCVVRSRNPKDKLVYGIFAACDSTVLILGNATREHHEGTLDGFETPRMVLIPWTSIEEVRPER